MLALRGVRICALLRKLTRRWCLRIIPCPADSHLPDFVPSFGGFHVNQWQFQQRSGVEIVGSDHHLLPMRCEVHPGSPSCDDARVPAVSKTAGVVLFRGLGQLSSVWCSLQLGGEHSQKWVEHCSVEWSVPQPAAQRYLACFENEALQASG